MKNKLIKNIALSAVLASSLFASDNLDNVVVTAKSNQSIADTAGSISIVTAKDISKMHASSVQDILEEVVGVNMSVNDSTFGGRESISIRGTASKHTLILIDGKIVSGSDAQIGHSDFQYNWLPISTISKIEIIKGPMSSIYGSQAIGGVINIITKKNNKKIYGDVDVTIGNNNQSGGTERDISFNIGGKVFDKLSMTLALQKKEIDPVIKEDNAKLYDREGKRIKNAMLGFNFDIDDTQEISASYLKGKEIRSFTTVNRRTKAVILRDEYYDIDKSNYSLGYLKRFQDITMDLKYYVTKSDSHTDEHQYTHKLKNSVLNTEFKIDSFDKHFIVAGLEYRKESYNKAYDNKLTSKGKATVDFKDDITYKSVYLQDEIEVNSKLILTLGARYDKHEKFGGELSPKANIVYKLDSNNRLKAGYGHGFSAPTVTKNSSAYSFSGAHVFMGNDDLKPEVSDTFELGYEYQKDKKLFKSTIYHTKIKDLIEGLKIGENKIPTGPGTFYTQDIHKYSNIGQVTINGLELEYTQKEILKDLDFNIGYNFIKTKNKDTGKELTARPKHNLNLKLSYALDYKINADARLNYTGVQKGDENKTLSGYTTASVQLSKEFAKNLTARIGIENLMDKKLSDDFNYQLKGRLLYLGINYKF